MPNVRYEFHGEVREIDLFAFFETIEWKSKGRAAIQHTTTIECKKSSKKPWVFFSSPSYAFHEVSTFLRYSSEFDEFYSSKQAPSLLNHIRPKITKSHYVSPTVPRCITYYEAFKGTSSAPSEIYRAIDSVITFLTHREEERENRALGTGDFSEFYVPIIVLDGHLFEASLSPADIKVEARQHLQLRTFHREDIYIIDIVTRDYFEQFFMTLADFHEELVAAIRSLKFPSDFGQSLLARNKALFQIVRRPKSQEGNPGPL